MTLDRSTKRVFLEISIDGVNEGRIIIELFDKIAPRTCENFRALCTGDYGKVGDIRMTYKGSIFHRVIKGFMLQGGDITAGNGTGGMSIYGRTFDDEEFMESHTEPYLLSMANKGPNTNSSQFFITTAIARHCDAKHVVFGRVVKGKDIVDKIEKLKVNDNSKPYQDVMVTNCGELFKKARREQETRREEESPANNENEKEPQEGKDQISTVRAEDLPPEPKTNNWLLRRSKSPERVRSEREKDRKSSSHRNRDRSGSRDRSSRRRSERDSRRDSHRSRSPRRRSPDRDSRRSGPRNYIEDRNERVQKETGIKVKGRGALRFQRNDRSVTPPHWRREEGKKLTLSDYQARVAREEERKKEVEMREKKEAAEREEREKERNRREMERELRRSERTSRRSSSGSDRRRKQRSDSSESDSDRN